MLVFVSIVTEVAAKPDLDATNVWVNDTNPDPGDLVSMTWIARNYTDDYVGSSTQGIMLSEDKTIGRAGSSDWLLATEGLGPMGGFFADTWVQSKTGVKIPNWVRPGRTYYIGVYADYHKKRKESSETNNGSNAFKITIRDNRPDLKVSGVMVNDTTQETNVAPGQLVKVSWTAANGGYSTGLKTAKQAVMYSTNSVIDWDDTVLDHNLLAGIGRGDTRSQSQWVKIPNNASIGSLSYLGVFMDHDGKKNVGSHNERSETNNASTGIPIRIAESGEPDLIAENLAIRTNLLTGETTTALRAEPGKSLFLTWYARNRGTKGTPLLPLTDQAILWSADSQVTKGDKVLETEGLGAVVRGGESLEEHEVNVPDNAIIGQTYSLAVYSDFANESKESDEENNLSNVVRILVVAPEDLGQAKQVTLNDRSNLPYLDRDDARLSSSGFVSNESRCFAPGDTGVINTLVEHDDRGLGDRLKTRVAAYSNTKRSESGRRFIGYSSARSVDTKSEAQFAIDWSMPPTVGNHYLQVVTQVEVPDVGGGTQWVETANAWLGGDDEVNSRVTVTNALPVILVHGWSDTGGVTFDTLEMMIEVTLKRPVRLFQYESALTPFSDTGNAPRVDKGENGKPSLANQLKAFLKNPEPGAAEIMEADLIAHSMGGLVARNYALKESKIRRMITIGTPNYGGNFANGLGDIILNNQAEDLEYGNATAWKLHREWEARLAGMPKLMAICGTNNFEFGVYNESDVLVKCSSASLENFGYPVYYVPRKHSSSQPLLGKAIADIDDAMHDSWPPIKRFLSEQDAPFVGLAGNLGGADDVGDKDHSSPLSGGMAYVLAHKGTPTSLDSLDANKVLWSPKINAELWGAHEIPLTGSGVYFLVGGTATGKNTGDRSYKNYKVTIQGSGITTESQDVKLFAGQTTVISMGDKGAPYLSDDTDGDLIPDHVEDEIIRYKTADRVLSLADVSEDGDFDGDGLTELLEVSLGSSSLIANHDDADTFSARAEDGFLVLRHSESKRDHGLKVVCEESTTLTGWRVARAEMRIILDLSTKQIKEWRLPIDGNQQFMRIKVKKR